MPDLSHISPSGSARMVDVSAKVPTLGKRGRGLCHHATRNAAAIDQR